MWCAENRPSTTVSDTKQFNNAESFHGIAKSGSYIATWIDNSVKIYTKDDLAELIALNFESTVNDICWSDLEGRFLLIAEHAGLLHTLHIKSQTVIQSKKLYQSYNDVKNTFLKIGMTSFGSKSLLFLLGSDNMLHTFLNMDFEAMDEALCSKDHSAALNLQKQIKHAICQTPEGTCSVIPYVQCDTLSFLTVGAAECTLGRVDYHDDQWTCAVHSSFPEFGGLKQGIVLSSQYLLALTTRGHLTMWSLLTFTVIKVWTEHLIDDFAALGSQCQRLSDCQLVVVGQLHGSDDKTLSIVTLPTIKPLYSYAVGRSKLSSDYKGELSVHFLTERNQTTLLTSVAQTSPEARYSQMLSQNRFDEALKFAKQYGLDMQALHKKRSEYLISNMAGDKVEAVIASLDNISDLHSVYDLCVSCQPLTYNATQSLVLYALKRMKAV